MSVISQRIPHPYRSSNRHGRPSNGAHSVIGGNYEVDRSPLIYPGFSGMDEVFIQYLNYERVNIKISMFFREV
jgi:hypothetical protein